MKKFCVDLEIAKELNKNSFPQSKFCWYRCYSNNKLKWFHGLFDENDKVNKQIFAPTSDEILKELPKQIVCGGKIYTLIIDCHLTRYEIQYVNYLGAPINLLFDFIEDPKLVNALAKCWLYLKKEGCIK